VKALLLLLVSAASASAEDWIDYELLMERYAADVAVTADAMGREVRRLDLGEGVIAVCDSSGCWGSDPSGIGCGFALVVEVRRALRSCPAFGTAEERRAIETLFDRLGEFVYLNGVPSRPWSEVRPQYDTLEQVEPWARQAPDCRSIAAQGPSGDYAQMLRNLAAAGLAPDLDKVLARPRITFINPCL